MLFFSEREFGHDVFVQCFDALSNIPKEKRFRAVARWLDLSEQTLKKYYRGDLSPPRAVCYAMWHECNIGQRFMRIQYGNDYSFWHSHAMHSKLKIIEQSEEIARLRALLGTAGAANDDWVTDSAVR